MKTAIEKLLVRGARSLSDSELLELLIDDLPRAEECVETIMQRYNMSLSKILGEDIARLRMCEGIGLKRAQRIVVAAELGRRAAVESPLEFTKISSCGDVVDFFKPKLESLPHEECWVLYLTSVNTIIESQRVSVGGVSATVVDHKLIIKRALELLATQIIMIHNHPSGVSDPSPEDIELTQRVNSAAALFDIKFLDHIIIARTGSYSFLSSKLL